MVPVIRKSDYKEGEKGAWIGILGNLALFVVRSLRVFSAGRMQ